MPKAAGVNRTGSAIVGSTLTYEARGRFKSYGPKTAVVTQGLMDDAERARKYWRHLKTLDKKELLTEYQSMNRLDTSHMSSNSAVDIRFSLLNQKFGNLTMTLIDEKLGGMKFLNKK